MIDAVIALNSTNKGNFQHPPALKIDDKDGLLSLYCLLKLNIL